MSSALTLARVFGLPLSSANASAGTSCFRFLDFRGPSLAAWIGGFLRSGGGVVRSSSEDASCGSSDSSESDAC